MRTEKIHKATLNEVIHKTVCLNISLLLLNTYSLSLSLSLSLSPQTIDHINSGMQDIAGQFGFNRLWVRVTIERQSIVMVLSSYIGNFTLYWCELFKKVFWTLSWSQRQTNCWKIQEFAIQVSPKSVCPSLYSTMCICSLLGKNLFIHVLYYMSDIMLYHYCIIPPLK